MQGPSGHDCEDGAALVRRWWWADRGSLSCLVGYCSVNFLCLFTFLCCSLRFPTTGISDNNGQKHKLTQRVPHVGLLGSGAARTPVSCPRTRIHCISNGSIALEPFGFVQLGKLRTSSRSVSRRGAIEQPGPRLTALITPWCLLEHVLAGAAQQLSQPDPPGANLAVRRGSRRTQRLV